MELLPPTPPLTDRVVTLRLWAEADVASVAEACRDEELLRWTTQIPENYSDADARNWIESTASGWSRGSADFAIEETATGRLVGAIGVVGQTAWTAEVGYRAVPAARGAGLTTRALVLVRDWAESLGFVRLQLTILPGNLASERVAEKAGFAVEGTLRSYANQRGVLRDVSMWSRLSPQHRSPTML